MEIWRIVELMNMERKVSHAIRSDQSFIERSYYICKLCGGLGQAKEMKHRTDCSVMILKEEELG